MTSRELFINTLKGIKGERPPVWFMRQAGRYMRSYRKIRDKYDFLTMCREPELAAEISLQPVRELGVDAAILFSDILTPLEPMGIRLNYTDGGGPILDLSGVERVDQMPFFRTEEKLGYVPETIRMLRKEMGNDFFLFGFCGAPFTLACYIYEGKHRKSFSVIRKIIEQDPESVHRLLALLADQMGEYLAAQIDAGVDGVQLFDTWAGGLPADLYRRFVLPYQKRTFDKIISERKERGTGKEAHSPLLILYVRNYHHPLRWLAESGADCISADETVDMKSWHSELCRIRPGILMQGNLSPFALYRRWSRIPEAADEILQRMEAIPFIFNLGHGILPDVPEQNVFRLVEYIKTRNPP